MSVNLSLVVLMKTVSFRIVEIFVNFMKIVTCLPTEHLGVLMNSLKRVRAFQIELEFGVLVFKERGKTGVPGKKPVEARENFVHISLRSRNTTYDKSCSLLFYKVMFFTEGNKLVIFWFFFSRPLYFLT